MPEENVFIMDGITTRWDDDVVVICEPDFGRTATLDNSGSILSSTFGQQGESFLRYWFARMKPMIDDLRAISREYANA